MEAVGILFVIVFWLIIPLVFTALAIASLVIWILMLIDCMKRKNWPDKDQQTIWIIVLVLAGGIGAIVYYFMIYKKLGRAY